MRVPRDPPTVLLVYHVTADLTASSFKALSRTKPKAPALFTVVKVKKTQVKNQKEIDECQQAVSSVVSCKLDGFPTPICFLVSPDARSTSSQGTTTLH